MRKTETKEFKFTLSEVNEEAGTFKGYASVWDVVDSYGDVVVKGAFKKTLHENAKFPMLWSHTITEPIGVISAREDKTGLAVEGAINLDVQRGREIRSLMKQGAVNGLSIGYQTIVEDFDQEAKTRHLKEIKLWEVSPCVFQACPNATVTIVKAESIDDDKNSGTEIIALPEGPTTVTPEAEPQTISEPEILHSLEEAALVKSIGEAVEKFHKETT